ncbi:hypothetical protein KKF55_00540 [Patescibacteria group bacterium]|nr:hypothetical protein [Patescibacteria group bacterium]
MEQEEIQKKVETFLQGLGVPSFIVFGWKKDKGDDPEHAQFGVVSSYHKVPTNVAIKGMSWALNDFIAKSL